LTLIGASEATSNEARLLPPVPRICSRQASSPRHNSYRRGHDRDHQQGCPQPSPAARMENGGRPKPYPGERHLQRPGQPEKPSVPPSLPGDEPHQDRLQYGLVKPRPRSDGAPDPPSLVIGQRFLPSLTPPRVPALENLGVDWFHELTLLLVITGTVT
jgi:hypothetical protein